MKKYLVDVPVLLLFFSRPEQFKFVFEQVKKARPSQLFLYQDGPREGREDDIKGIKECRKIAENIDWECEVKRLYQEKNYGCDPSEYISQKWAFSYVDKCIVLEDDDVPSISFFSFCKEMLDKYENDTRIGLISGFNHEEITKDVDEDYFFTSNVSIWGWASWKRVIDQWDEKYTFLDNKTQVNRLKEIIISRGYLKNFLEMCRIHKNTGKAHYESILIANHWLNNYLAIVPKKNMINNIGVTADSTHFNGNINCQPRGLRKIFTMNKYEIGKNILHPRYVNEHYFYKERVYRIMGWGHPFVKLYRFSEESVYYLKNIGLKKTVKYVFTKLKKLKERETY